MPGNPVHGSTPRPAAQARLIASVRSFTWSLVKTWLTWLRTVLGEATSWRAISLVGHAAGEKFEHFPLAVGQLGKQHQIARRQQPRQVGQDAAGDLRAEDHIAARDRLQRPQQLVGVRALHDVAAGPGAIAANTDSSLVQHGQDEHGHTRVGGDDPASPRRR